MSNRGLPPVSFMRDITTIAGSHTKRWQAARAAMANAVERDKWNRMCTKKYRPSPDVARPGMEFVNGCTGVEAETRIQQIMKEYPHLSYSEASLLDIFRHTKEHCAAVQNTSGGGKYHAYIRKIGVQF